MAAMKLFGNVYSPPTRACLWLLKTFDLPYSFKDVDVWGGEVDTPEFKKLNPASTVPVLLTNNSAFRLFQGSCIMKYLCERYDLSDDVGGALYPKDDLEKRAKIDQWLFWQHLNIRSAAGALIHVTTSKEIRPSHSLKPSLSAKGNNADVANFVHSVNRSVSFKDRKKMYGGKNNLEAGGSFRDRHMESRGGKLVVGDMSTVDRALVVLNTILEDRPFIGGDSYGLADIRIGFEMQTLEAERHVKYARFGDVRYDLSDEGRLPPNVEMWMARMCALPGFCDTSGMLELHEKLFSAQRNFFLDLGNHANQASSAC